MQLVRVLIISSFFVSCSGAIDTNPAPKSNGTVLNNGQNNGVNNGANNVNNVGDENWNQWGTRGPFNQNPKSPDGFAHCLQSDIRTDDLTINVDPNVPDGMFDAQPVMDAVGRCGDDLETMSWRFHNCERISRNLTPLKCDLRLVWVSRQHTNDMRDNDFFDHVGSDGSTPFNRMQARGIGFAAAAENIVINSSLEGAHFGWMDSQGHRENILGDYEYMGVGSWLEIGGTVLLTAAFTN